MALTRGAADNSWHALYLLAEDAQTRQRERPTKWQYTDFMFAKCAVSASRLKQLFSSESEVVANLAGLAIVIPTIEPSFQWTYNHSRSSWANERRDRPTTVMELRERGVPMRNQPTGLMVGLGRTPTFNSWGEAYNVFFYGSYTGRQDRPSELATVVRHHDAAWLGEVLITPTHLQVAVLGSNVKGATLELVAGTDLFQKRLDGAGSFDIALPDGLPPSATLWLKRKTDCLDCRPLNYSWLSDAECQAQGVSVEQDLQSFAQSLLAGGEGLQTEFKQVLPWGSGGQAKQELERRTLKTVAAFANGSGGTILFGVDRDEMTVVGVPDNDKPGTRDHLAALIRQRVIPEPVYKIDWVSLDSKPVVVLRIEPSGSFQHVLLIDQDRPELYVRRQASTYFAWPADLRSTPVRPYTFR